VSRRGTEGGAGGAWRALAVGFGLLALALGAVALWALLELRRESVATPVAPAPRPAPPVEVDRLDLEPASFAELPGWPDDALEEALPALRRSCAAGLGGTSAARAVAGDPALWRRFCTALAALGPSPEPARLRLLVERELVPRAVTNGGRRDGLLTGYYEPELAGSRHPRGSFVHPIYLNPGDQQVVDLGEFRRDLAGRKITGQVRGGRFRPYWDRSEIERGALARRGLELLWVDDPVALFFLQIQGSGRIVLPRGEVVRVGYAGQNGHDYTPIGRRLVEMGELELEAVSLQSIRAWLRAHPERAADVMNANRSYVFFRILRGSAPEGASGVELTAGRSLAVDDAFLPYGVPLWAESSLPAVADLGLPERPLRRLVVAQDTGGAITGPVRGDLFLGPGREAEETAGRMRQPLRLWLLVPRAAPVAP
jgi:membrane-bound lytic murein transglycosylase A